MTVKIQNIVVSASLGTSIDLNYISQEIGCRYDPAKFPGAIYKITDPKCSMLIFRTGKVICSGTTSHKFAKKAVGILVKALRNCGIDVERYPKIEVQNIVASSDVGFQVNLDQLIMDEPCTEYEPEQFPGLVFRLDEPKTVMLVFRSGKIIITGAKTEEAANVSAEKTRNVLKEYKSRVH